MQLGAIGGSSLAGLQQGHGPPAAVKQAFQDLGTAIDSGNLDDAKSALAKLDESGPPKSDLRANPMSDKMDALKKAVESGDVKAAQSAWADMKQGLAQGPPGGGTQFRMPNLTVNAPARGPSSNDASPADSYASSASSGSSSSATAIGAGEAGPAAAGDAVSGSASAASSSTFSLKSLMYAKADANQDGLVSATERLTYDLKHPAASSNYLAPGSLLDMTG